MINQDSKAAKSPLPLIVMIFGALLNLAAIFTKDSGALVAVGCSLIAIGAATRKRAQNN